jgi:hypothetical protein
MRSMRSMRSIRAPWLVPLVVVGVGAAGAARALLRVLSWSVGVVAAACLAGSGVIDELPARAGSRPAAVLLFAVRVTLLPPVVVLAVVGGVLWWTSALLDHLTERDTPPRAPSPRVPARPRVRIALTARTSRAA